VWMERFLRRRELPALAKLLDEGVTASLVSTLPATTPVAWTSIVTGATPAVHGIESFLVHLPGDPLDQRVSGCYAHRCRAEPIWETVTLAGKRSLIVKFPVSYPSRTASFRLDGAAGWGGLKCLHEAAPASVADSSAVGEAALIESRQAWEGHPAATDVYWWGVWSLVNTWHASATDLHCALARGGDGKARVYIAEAADWQRLLAALEVGEWSDPISLIATGRREEAEYCFRVKLLAADLAPRKIRLLNTPLHERRGHSFPEQTWERCLSEAGPIEEQTDPSLAFSGGIDLETQLEIYELNANWLGRVSQTLLADNDWDLFLIQAHFVDWAHHLLEGVVNPEHPAFRAAQAAGFENLLLEAFRLADRLVDRVREAVGPETNLIVLGDHGQDVHHTTIRMNEWLASEGLLEWADEVDEVDWSRTECFAAGNSIYLNRRGREPEGIVPPDRVDELTRSLLHRLQRLVDPASGVRPILVADEKNGFASFGANGAGVGDIVFCLRSGYQSRNDRGSVFAPTVPLLEFTSGHDHFSPLEPRLHTRLFGAGPDLRHGARPATAASVIDVAPTISAVLDIPAPKHSQGRALANLLANPPEAGSRKRESPLPASV
jgi:predicted AlkP superfamily phosphohydrolase/phosphomutase